MISNQPRSKQGEQMREKAHEAADAVSQKAKEGAGRMREQLHSMAEDTKQRGKSMVQQQKHTLAEKLRHIGKAMGAAAKQLHQEHDDTVAEYAEAMCDRIDDAASYIDDLEVDEIIDNIESFARRQPQLFLGGMFLVGIAAARFLKASKSPHDGQSSSHRSGQPGTIHRPQQEAGGSMPQHRAQQSAGPSKPGAMSTTPAGNVSTQRGEPGRFGSSDRPQSPSPQPGGKGPRGHSEGEVNR